MSSISPVPCNSKQTIDITTEREHPLVACSFAQGGPLACAGVAFLMLLLLTTSKYEHLMQHSYWGVPPTLLGFAARKLCTFTGVKLGAFPSLYPLPLQRAALNRNPAHAQLLLVCVHLGSEHSPSLRLFTLIT